jgi:hypothetical protein
VLGHERITGIIALMSQCISVSLTTNFHPVAPGTSGLAQVRPKNPALVVQGESS